jgi:flagellin
MPGFIINTNVKALNAQVSADSVNRALTYSLEKLSSGLRINKSADDASGMAIADSLRSQANTLAQAMRNTNDAISMVQVADKAMDEQVKVLDTIKTKAAQAAQDTQNFESRSAIQRDIIRLIEQLDNIAFQTSYNGLKMLAGSFTNKQFQVGAYSNETIGVSIGATSSDKIGATRKETSNVISASGNAALKFKVSGKDITLETVKISTSAGTGVGALAEVINKNSDILGGIRATYSSQIEGTAQIGAGNITNLTINGVTIGAVDGITTADSNGNIRNAINKYTTETGVVASVDEKGQLVLTSNSGRGIKVSVSGGALNLAKNETYGRLTLTNLSSNDIVVSASANTVLNGAINSGSSTYSFNLREVTGLFNYYQIDAGGGFANRWGGMNSVASASGAVFGAGVTSREGAMIVMDIAESAINLLDRIRSDIGSAQQQLEVTLNNISVTQVNVKAAESGIRDVDFGSESSNFSKQSILMQSGSYALSQANALQQNVLRLLQ